MRACFRYVGRREGGGGGGGEGGEGETWNRAVSEHVTKFKSGGAIVMRAASARSDAWLPKSASAGFDSIAAFRSKPIGSMRHGTIDTLSPRLGYCKTPESHYECRSTFRRDTLSESFRRAKSNEEEAQKKEEARAKENGVKSGHGERAEKKGRRNVREYTRESKRETIGMQVARYVVLGHA